MSNVVIEFQEDTQTAFCLYVAYHDGDFLCVQHISKGDLLEYRLSLSHVESIKAIPSLSDLLAYAKANQIQQPQADTLCPCPPETSPLDEVGVGIPARHMLLSETVSGGLSITGCFSPADFDNLFRE